MSALRPFPLVLASLIAPLLLAAPSPEEGRLLSRVFLPEDFRGNTVVRDVAQTPDGLIYAANLGAIKEFDGNEWHSIAVPTSWIWKLAPAPDGRLYLAGVDELGFLEPDAHGRRVFRSLLAGVPAAALPLGQLRQCLVHDGAVYWSSAHHVLRWREGRMHAWTFPDDADLALRDGGTHLYLAVTGEGLLRLEGDAWRTITHDARLARPLPLVLDAWAGVGPLAVDPDGTFWRFDDAGTITAFPTALSAADVAGGVVHGLVLHDERLALSTRNGGLLLLTNDGRIDLRFGLDGGVGVPVMNNLFQDREGGLWIGTELGLARVDLDRAITMFDEHAGIPPGVGLSVFRHEGGLHACGKDGLYRFVPGEDGHRGHFERLEGPMFLPYGTEAHPSGRLIIADQGLLRLSHGVLTTEYQPPAPAYVIALSINDRDRMFMAGTGFLRTLHWDGSSWRDEGEVQGMHEDVISMAEDHDGSLWIGTPTHGVVRVHPRAGQTGWQTAEVTRYDTARGLPEGHEWATTYPGGARPLFSHSRGVSVHDPINDRIVPAPAFSAVGHNDRYVFPLTAGFGDSVWAQLGNPDRGEPMELGGVVRGPAGNWQWVLLPARVLAALGFPGAYQMSWEPGPREDGVLWIVSRGKIVRVDLAAEREQAQPKLPVVLLRAVARGDAALPFRSTDAPALTAERAPLRLRFASPSFEQRGLLEFQHRLLGYDERWSAWTPGAESEFTNLPAGDFVFEVRARADGGEPGPATRWAFAIALPWWRGWPAFAVYALALVGAVWGLLRWRTAALEAEKLTLSRIVQERTDELARERDRADAANRAKTVFLANMSHELRTPLHAILGYSQLLGADTTLPEATRERLGIVGSSGRHLLRLINEVLDISKIEAGKLELQSAPFDLPALLTAVADAQKPRATAKGLTFRAPDPSGLPLFAAGDAAKIRQVLENLLGNAIKFTARGEVRLLAVPAGSGRVHFEISDSGPGIAPGDLARLFQPFTQLQQTGLAPTESGTGLGLAIAQRLVALLGGRLEVASVVGQGSRFWFEIALAEATGAKPGARPARRIVGYDGPRRRVLVIDDIEANRRLFVDLLAPLGFELAEAASAAECRTRLESFRPDLVLLDLRLPDTDGFSLARQMRADPRLEGLKILAASASVFGQNPADAFSAGCDGFIAKPFLAEDFFDRIAALLGLNWREVDDRPAFAEEALDPALLAPLHAAAQTGDIVAAREAFAHLRERHPRAANLDPMAAAIAAFDTARLVHLTQPARTS